MLVFFIHGVATRDVKYADTLQNLIKEKFIQREKPLPYFYSSFWGAVLKDISKLFNWIHQDLQEAKKNHPQTSVDDIFRYQKFREGFFSEFVGDILSYLNPERGLAIRKLIAQQLYDFLKNNPEETELHIVAHSLGTVILWDVLFSDRFSSKDPASYIRAMLKDLNQPNVAHKASLKSITTMGSPILFLNTMLDVKPEQVKKFVDGYQEEPLHWLNIIHSSDVIAYPLRSSLKIEPSCNLSFQDIFIHDEANSMERALSEFANSNNKVVQAIGLVNPLINEAVAHAPMFAGAGDGHTGYWNCRQTASLITANILGKTEDTPTRQGNTIERVINCLNQVDGMTDKSVTDLRLHLIDKTLEEITFKDDSGKLLLVVNPLQVHHVYVFDSSENCKFSGYVGVIHGNGLKKMVNSIKNFSC